MKQRNFLLLFLLIPLLGHAELTWETKAIEHEALPTETKFEAAFNFTNSGNETVTITNIRSTCGCTTASLDKNTYAPGESGSIKATFTYGARKGGQSKLITVSTDQKQEPNTSLTLNVYIPEVFKLEGSPVLVWKCRDGEELNTRSIRIYSDYEEPIEIIDIISSNPQTFDFELQPQEEPNTYLLLVTPKPEIKDTMGEKQILRGKFTIKSNFPTEGRGTITVYALIK